MNHEQKQLLRDILTIKRPHGGKGEQEILSYIQSFILNCGGLIPIRTQAGLELRVGTSDCLFVAHVDTVHRTEGYQTVKCSNGIYRTTDGECLGADDGAGVWLLLQLIQRNIPGYYLFSIGEECGGIGARWFQCPTECLRAFEFDRRGKTELIANHGASDKYSKQLASLLGLQVSHSGVYTDIASISGPIEKVNVSCGYENAHSLNETLDSHYLEYLMVRFVRQFKAIQNLRLYGPELELLDTWGDDENDEWLRGMGRKKASRMMLRGGLW